MVLYSDQCILYPGPCQRGGPGERASDARGRAPGGVGRPGRSPPRGPWAGRSAAAGACRRGARQHFPQPFGVDVALEPAAVGE